MQITLNRLDFIYLNNKVRARISAREPNTQWSGNLEIEIVIERSESVEEMKASAVTAASELLSRVASEMKLDAVLIGPQA